MTTKNGDDDILLSTHLLFLLSFSQDSGVKADTRKILKGNIRFLDFWDILCQQIPLCSPLLFLLFLKCFSQCLILLICAINIKKWEYLFRLAYLYAFFRELSGVNSWCTSFCILGTCTYDSSSFPSSPLRWLRLPCCSWYFWWCRWQWLAWSG